MAETTRLGQSAQDAPAPQPPVRRILGGLFPPSGEEQQRTPGRRLLGVAAQAAAVVVAVALLLERITGMPSWDTVYAEDYRVFFIQALQQPWHVYISFGGYEELLPRVLAQVATYFPLPQVSRWFAVSGALVAALCALFVFHASAGHVRSTPLRALLGAAIVFMPIVPMELADSGVNSPWFLLPATFWALLWRPRTRFGMAMAALMAFTAAASEIITALFLPLALARLFVLRRPREHAVTVGLLAGCLFQLPALVAGRNSTSAARLTGKGPLGQSLAFYAHTTVLPAFGWHLAWRVQAFVGRNEATVIMAAILAVIIGAILATQPRNRPFVVVAVLTGIVFSVFDTTLNPHVAAHTFVSPAIESGSRYSMLPIFLFVSAAVVGVDTLIRHRAEADGRREIRLGPAIAVVALVAVLGANWVADFRYASYRSHAHGAYDWGQISAKWQHDCASSGSGEITEKVAAIYQTLPCDRIHP